VRPVFKRGMPARQRFEYGDLPDAQKRDLCERLLTEHGMDIRQSKEDELVVACTVSDYHQDQARNPTGALNWDKLTYHCLSGETLVKTYEGEREIKDLAGGVHRLLDGAGKWVDAPVKAYGEDRLYRVTLSRNGTKKVIYATADHRWYIKRKGEYSKKGRESALSVMTTLDLKPKMRVPSVWPMKRTGRTLISPVGVMRGFVYGDGTSTEFGAVANFFGSKDESLLPYFSQFEVLSYDGVRKIIRGLPRSWKIELPALDEGISFLWGWLAGYFAADGCVADDGHLTLSCSDEDTLQFVMTICDRLGVATYTLSGGDREGGGLLGKGSHSLHTLSFRSSSLIPEFFLIPEHRRRYEAAILTRKYERTNWWVTSVKETDRFEMVYCAEVSTTQSFVLAGNILTGNCLGCGAGGGLLWFIGVLRDCSAQEARAWLEGETGTGGQLMELADLMRYFDALYQPKTAPPPIPTFSERVLEPWQGIHPYLTETERPYRGIRYEDAERFRCGYAEHYVVGRRPDGTPITSERIVLPHFWQGSLVGWQTRRLWDDGTPKFLSSSDFPKDRTIYNYDRRADEAVVVEAMLSTIKHDHLAHFEATFGAAITDRQRALLAKHRRVTLWLDNDTAGWNALQGVYLEKHGKMELVREGVGAYLSQYTEVYAVQNPYAADPADMTADDVARLLDAAVPYWLWERPIELLCYRCGEVNAKDHLNKEGQLCH